MPLDTSIPMSGRPLKIQFRDLGAEYNQLAQMQSAQNQNQLAQMQMQEHRQLAPLRLQEQQSRAASTKLTYDQAKQAQDFVTGVMSKAAEHPEAPQDPMDAAMQMLQHPNPQVQAIGGHLLDASQKLMAYKNQMANEKAYEEDWRAGAPAGAPVVTAPSANDVVAPMVKPGAEAPVGIDQGKGVVAFPVKSGAIVAEGTISLAPDVKINAKYQSQIVDKLKDYGETASLKEFPGMRWTLSPGGLLIREPIPVESAPIQSELINALAPAAAPPVNAMAKKAVNPLQDAAALMKQIQDGDDRFARGGTPAPGWKNKRELLVKAFEQAVKVERNQGQRYISLGAGAALDTESGLIIAKDKIPAAAAAPRIISIKGVPHTVNAEGNLEPLTVEGGALPAAAVTAAPKIINIKGIPHTLNEDGNLVPVPVEGGVLPAVAAKSQAVVAPKIINIKGIPHTLNAEGNLVPLTVEGGVSPAPAAAAVTAAPKIINIKGIPHTLNAEGKLVRVPIEGGALPVVGKVGTGKQAAGGAISKPKPPSGYRYDATGENLEPIPGGPADKTKEGPAKEGGATEGERKAATLLQRLQFSEAQLTEALVNNPNAAKPGVFASAVAMLSTPLANSLTPEARQRVQSAQLDILDAALTLGTGAAYTREQLEGYREAYFPQIGDKPNQIKDKQARLNNVISAAKIAAGKAAKLVPAAPAPTAAGGGSAMSAADAILNKGRR